MLASGPSRTALGAALHRAAHQLLGGGRIFADPLALPILGEGAEAAAREAAERPGARALRFFIAARSRLAETWLAQSVERGTGQLVLLGAGLDTFAYRNPFGARLRVFELDHRATQAWKRQRLAAAGIATPDTVRFVAVDFEREAWLDPLVAAGFDPHAPAFFIWLGVVYYLTGDAIRSTLAAVAGLPGGAEIAFDYSEPPAALAPEAQAIHADLAGRVADLGEPFRTHFEPAALHVMLHAHGFATIEDLGPEALLDLYLDPAALDALRAMRERPRGGGHVVRAAPRR